jgi:peptide/nickel transport system ATP-binding protein
VASAPATVEAPVLARPGSLLEVRDLHTQFFTSQGVVKAVNGVSFALEQGELVGLVGETGCGKSVTARSILGLVRSPGRIVKGAIEFEGTDLRTLKRRELRRLRGADMSFVPQNPWGALNPILRIERQFRNVIQAHRSASSRECWELGLDMLRKVGIQGPERVLKGYAHELSGGMAQRVVIGLSLVLSPRLVIADEPTTGLDVTIQRQILDLIVEVLQRERRAMLLVSHDLGIVAQYCHKVIVMYAGKVVEMGPVAEVFVSPAHPYTQALLAAIPRPGQRLVSLRGTVPSLIDYPQGCPFRERCDYVHERSGEEEPLLREIAPRRFLACHLPKGVTEHAAGTD